MNMHVHGFWGDRDVHIFQLIYAFIIHTTSIQEI
jgi:hypothetical protein